MMTEANMFTEAGKFLNILIDIANKAVEVDELEIAAGIEKDDLRTAYADYKRREGIDTITQNTPEWEAMIAATTGEYQSSEAAKRKVYNAKRRLKTAIDNYRKVLMENQYARAA
ncbi:hypothetical protein [Pseudogemmobacter bohemicus]|uniref:hypothetical protein n=1 Tax=Pseudogemmobacter bohemicus TaxID=2250708 RepID=UPI000DD2DA57|nr:hypothetical protein [Pseudogemmobacter bohemicus]